MTPLLGNSPAWRTAEPSKLAGDEGELALLCTVLESNPKNRAQFSNLKISDKIKICDFRKFARLFAESC